jgi:hypothetical protein
MVQGSEWTNPAAEEPTHKNGQDYSGKGPKQSSIEDAGGYDGSKGYQGIQL